MHSVEESTNYYSILQQVCVLWLLVQNSVYSLPMEHVSTAGLCPVVACAEQCVQSADGACLSQP